MACDWRAARPTNLVTFVMQLPTGAFARRFMFEFLEQSQINCRDPVALGRPCQASGARHLIDDAKAVSLLIRS